MTTLDNRLLGQVAQGLASDGRSLDALKREAQRDPRGAVKKAAQQFEALFMQMVLKSMRDALPNSGLLDSTAREMYTGLLDQQLATRVAASGTGLADMIARQLTRHIPASAAGRSDAAPPAAAGALPSVPERLAAPAAPDPNGAARYAELLPGGATAAARDAPAQRLAAAGAPRDSADGEPTPASGGASVQRRFVLRHWDHALAAERQTGIPAQFIVGQAALESGWGQYEIRDAAGRPSHNLFGIKAGPDWRGRTVEVTTTEYDDGVEKKVVERFRAYDSYGEAFHDWARLMASNPRYAAVLRAGRDASGFAQGLQRAGYATDPQYGAKLARLIDTAAALKGRA
ncbi:MAG: flagellar assembly peptidoglycan hydrolase FlgJ [Burkholderiaceae bacterium]